LLETIERVRRYRSESKRAATRKLASQPALFGEIRHNEHPYLLVPRVSSERRNYIPIGFLDSATIATDAAIILPNATPYHFGILTSAMHMAWVRHICGRLESRYRYSAKLVYNNFPWPRSSPAQQARIARLANAILSARSNHPDSTLADLYDPRTMPADLAKAHQALDRAVDGLYRRGGFADDMERFAHLIALYERLAGGSLITTPASKRAAR
jgi:hypothetical protein